MANTSTKKLAQELTDIERDGALTSERAQRALTDALASRDPRLVAQAARLVGAHSRRELEQPLAAAYRAFSGEQASADAGCLAREALLIALDALEHLDAELFGEAAMYVQHERLKGGVRETAARVRARGLLGVARLGHRDLLPILGACLADRDGTVRLSAARAAAHRGQREAAGLLLLRLGVGDAEPEVASECLRALFALAPDLARKYAQVALRSDEQRTREQTLHALGTAADDSAVELLSEELAQRVLTDERRPVIEALGLSLRPRARSLLLDLVRDGRPADSEAALAALAIHRYDTRLVEQLRELTGRSRELSALFKELYDP
jgi:hypothetical protein